LGGYGNLKDKSEASVSIRRETEKLIKADFTDSQVKNLVSFLEC
jgi:hypothetical protein